MISDGTCSPSFLSVSANSHVIGRPTHTGGNVDLLTKCVYGGCLKGGPVTTPATSPSDEVGVVAHDLNVPVALLLHGLGHLVFRHRAAPSHHKDDEHRPNRDNDHSDTPHDSLHFSFSSLSVLFGIMTTSQRDVAPILLRL